MRARTIEVGGSSRRASVSESAARQIRIEPPNITVKRTIPDMQQRHLSWMSSQQWMSTIGPFAVVHVGGQDRGRHGAISPLDSAANV